MDLGALALNFMGASALALLEALDAADDHIALAVRTLQQACEQQDKRLIARLLRLLLGKLCDLRRGILERNTAAHQHGNELCQRFVLLPTRQAFDLRPVPELGRCEKADLALHARPVRSAAVGGQSSPG